MTKHKRGPTRRKKRSVPSKTRKISITRPASGVCRFCGCTEKRRCYVRVTLPEFLEHCRWVDVDKTLCSNPSCLDKAEQEEIRKSKSWVKGFVSGGLPSLGRHR